MRHVAIIPARASSKSVINKNIRKLGNKSLVDIAVDSALGAGFIDEVYISTDIEVVQDDYQAHEKVLVIDRPRIHCEDSSTMDGVVSHALDHMGSIGSVYLWLLQPSSPFREKHDFIAIKKIIDNERPASVISVKECVDDHPDRCYAVNHNELNRLKHTNFRNKQDLKPMVRRNGCFYVFRAMDFKKKKDFFLERCLAYVMPEHRSVNIDSEFDFAVARTLSEKKIYPPNI